MDRDIRGAGFDARWRGVDDSGPTGAEIDAFKAAVDQAFAREAATNPDIGDRSSTRARATGGASAEPSRSRPVDGDWKARAGHALIGTAELTGGIAVGAAQRGVGIVKETAEFAWEGVNAVNDAGGTVLNAAVRPLGVTAFEGHAKRTAARRDALYDGIASLPRLPSEVAESMKQGWNRFEHNWDTGNYHEVGKQMGGLVVDAATIAVPASKVAPIAGKALAKAAEYEVKFDRGTIGSNVGNFRIEKKATVETKTDVDAPALEKKQAVETKGKIDPLDPVLEYDKDGNEVYYRTMKESHFKILQETDELTATGETSLSPLESYSQRYTGALVKLTVKKGTSSQLQEIGIAADSISSQKFPNMPKEAYNWSQTHARFKVEASGNTHYNDGNGVMNTQLGKGNALKIFQDNLISYELIRIGNGLTKVKK